jgi:hypothetical protein
MVNVTNFQQAMRSDLAAGFRNVIGGSFDLTKEEDETRAYRITGHAARALGVEQYPQTNYVWKKGWDAPDELLIQMFLERDYSKEQLNRRFSGSARLIF